MRLNTSIGLLILRLSLGILMLMHGISKIINSIGGIENMLEDAGIPTLFAYVVFIGEVIAPVLLIVGYRTKLAALVFGINCLFAMLLGHSEDIFSIGKYGNWGVELLGLYLFGSMALFFTGGGTISISVKNLWD